MRKQTSLFLLLITTKTPKHHIENKVNTLNGGEKTNQQGTSGHQEWRGGEIPGFSICLVYQVWIWRSCQTWNQWVQTKKLQWKSTFLGKEPRKGQPGQTENFYTIPHSSQITWERNYDPGHIHASKGWLGEPRRSPLQLQGVLTLLWDNIKERKLESQDIHPILG